MAETLKNIPSWLVLLVLLLILLGLYQIRPDATSEDLVKAVAGALLLSLRSTQPPSGKVEIANTPSNPVPTEETGIEQR